MASSRYRSFSWRRKLTKVDLAITVIGLALVFSFSFLFKSSFKNYAPTFNVNSDFVKLTLVKSAKEKGAFCLDGSLPGYHFEKGFESGSNNWVLHLEGGGWCDSIASCSHRKRTPLGSSQYMEHEVLFSGILSQDRAQNPDFFNWNKVKIRYCDGASFAGSPENEFHNGTNLFFRGQRIWDAIMDELLAVGMSNAKQALLSGCSAGGLATMIHCENFRRSLPEADTVKCLADGGFFLNAKDLSGRPTLELFYQDVVKLHGVAKSLPRDCVTKMESHLCFFPKQVIRSMNTPLFLVNPAYDFWQIQNVLVPRSAMRGDWRFCRLNIKRCTPHQMEILHGFRNSMLNELDEFKEKEGSGMFLNSCFSHCQTMKETWHGSTSNSPKIDNKTIAESVGDWYFNRERVKRVDGPFPCNPSCLNVDLLGP